MDYPDKGLPGDDGLHLSLKLLDLSEGREGLRPLGLPLSHLLTGSLELLVRALGCCSGGVGVAFPWS